MASLDVRQKSIGKQTRKGRHASRRERREEREQVKPARAGDDATDGCGPPASRDGEACMAAPRAAGAAGRLIPMVGLCVQVGTYLLGIYACKLQYQ